MPNYLRHISGKQLWRVLKAQAPRVTYSQFLRVFAHEMHQCVTVKRAIKILAHFLGEDFTVLEPQYTLPAPLRKLLERRFYSIRGEAGRTLSFSLENLRGSIDKFKSFTRPAYKGVRVKTYIALSKLDVCTVNILAYAMGIHAWELVTMLLSSSLVEDDTEGGESLMESVPSVETAVNLPSDSLPGS